MLILDDYGPYGTSIEMPPGEGTVHAWADFVDHECTSCKGDGAPDSPECECITGWVGWWIDGGTDVINRSPATTSWPKFLDWTGSVIAWSRVSDAAWDHLIRRAFTVNADPTAIGPRAEYTALLARQADRLTSIAG